MDADSQQYSDHLSSDWVDAFISEFTTLWENFLSQQRSASPNDISVNLENLQDVGNGQSPQKELLKTLISRMKKTAANSEYMTSGMESVSIIESSEFTLEQAFDEDSEEAESVSMMQYILHK
jgi:type VI protein secretion system component VasK